MKIIYNKLGMSINDFPNKIKGNFNLDTFTIMCLLVVIGVGVFSFALGRLSMKEKIAGVNEPIIIEDSSKLNNTTLGEKEKRYVASKNGKLYYTNNCSSAGRISENNRIWFSTSFEAEAAGYSFAQSCQ